ncbi:MAG: NAD(P)-dependent oxidoreductase [Candidatus Omnitrophota bacterium]
MEKQPGSGKMRILITGGTGLLGKALIEEGGRSREITATYIGNYDIADPGGVKYRKLDLKDTEGYGRLFRESKPEVVIHTAGLGSPDYVEKNREESWQVNVKGTQDIVDLCEEYGSKFIYISSNGIYDGGHAPYSEGSEALPINYYGVLKLEGEQATRKAAVPYAIVRPILMYGWNHPFERGNIVTIALSKLKKGEEFSAYDDVYSTPLYVKSCAGAIWKIIDTGKYDVFNIGGAERVSVYGLIVKAAEVFGYDTALVKPVKQGHFNEFTKRPVDTSFNTDKMRKALGIEPLSVGEGMRKMKEARS